MVTYAFCTNSNIGYNAMLQKSPTRSFSYIKETSQQHICKHDYVHHIANISNQLKKKKQNTVDILLSQQPGTISR